MLRSSRDGNRSALTDFVTLLTCEPGKRLAKAWHPGEVRPRDYDGGSLFQTTIDPVTELGDLADLLEVIEGRPDVCVIRGAVDPEVTPDDWVQRLSVSRPDADAAFSEAAHRWVALDVDESTTPFDVADPKASIEAWRASLPAELAGVGVVFQLSAQAHISPTLRGRAWIWLSAPAGNAALRPWAVANGFDPAHFTPVAIHYTAAPVFEGLPDPLEGRRLHYFPGPVATLDLEAVEASAAAERISTPVDVGPASPRYDAARARVLAALGPATERDGSRWTICGPLGGAARKAGWPIGDAAALVREWLAPGGQVTRGIDPGPGVERALGAYGLADPDTATGLGELGSLLGPEAAGAIGDALADAAWPRVTVIKAYEASLPPPDWVAGLYERDRFERGPLAYINEGLRLARGKASALVGGPGSGKGPWALWYGIHAALGLPVWGWDFSAPTRTVYLCHEGYELASIRRGRMCDALKVDERSIPFEIFRARGPLSQPNLKALAEWCEGEGVGQIILDTYTSANRGGASQNDAAYADLLWDIGDLSEEYGITALVLMHTSKAGREGLDSLLGTNALGAALQTAWTLAGVPGKSEAQAVCARATGTHVPPFGIAIKDVDGGGLSVERIAASEVTAAGAKPPSALTLESLAKRARAAEALWREVEASGVALPIKTLQRVSGLGRTKCYELVRDLVLAGALEDLGGGNYRRPEGATRATVRFALGGG